MNRENILAVADAIEKHSIPDLGFNMGDFVRRATGDDIAVDRSGHSCDTIACIAGWARRLRTGKPVKPTDVRVFDWTKEARWLGLAHGERQSDYSSNAYNLFYGAGWTGSVLLSDITPSQAVTVLRHLAETGEVDWNRALAEPSK